MGGKRIQSPCNAFRGGVERLQVYGYVGSLAQSFPNIGIFFGIIANFAPLNDETFFTDNPAKLFVPFPVRLFRCTGEGVSR
jgi:hypothetical protein